MRMSKRPPRTRKQHVKSRAETAFLVALGQRIRELREEKYSQEEFAHLIDVFRTHMSTIERGKTDIKTTTLYRIAEVLEIELSDLLRFPVPVSTPALPDDGT